MRTNSVVLGIFIGPCDVTAALEVLTSYISKLEKDSRLPRGTSKEFVYGVEISKYKEGKPDIIGKLDMARKTLVVLTESTALANVLKNLNPDGSDRDVEVEDESWYYLEPDMPELLRMLGVESLDSLKLRTSTSWADVPIEDPVPAPRPRRPTYKLKASPTELSIPMTREQSLLLSPNSESYGKTELRTLVKPKHMFGADNTMNPLTIIIKNSPATTISTLDPITQEVIVQPGRQIDTMKTQSSAILTQFREYSSVSGYPRVLRTSEGIEMTYENEEDARVAFNVKFPLVMVSYKKKDVKRDTREDNKGYGSGSWRSDNRGASSSRDWTSTRGGAGSSRDWTSSRGGRGRGR